METVLPKEPPSVKAPPYSVAEELIRQHERMYGASGIALVAPGDAETTAGPAGLPLDASRRSRTIRGREIRLRRMLLVEPRIPEAYAKTTQRVRAGQSMIGDIALRIPATLLSEPYKARMQPVEDEDEAREASTRVEEFLQAFLLGRKGQRAVLDQGEVSVWRDVMDNLTNYGDGCFQLVSREDRWSVRNRYYPRYHDYEDDGEEVSKTRRRTRDQKYMDALQRFRRGTPPFVLENLDPQMVHVAKDYDGREDEAVIVAERPYRETLARYGLMPSKSKYGTDILKSGDGRRAYLAGPNGLGQAFPLDEFPVSRYQPKNCRTVTYYCSAERAYALGLTDGSDPDLGVWAHYVDGVLVAHGGLWGPQWHPLPIFTSPGLSTAIPDPNFRGVPILMHLVELGDLLDQIFTMEMHIAFWTAFAPVIEEDKSSSGGGTVGLPENILDDPESVGRPGTDGGALAGGIKYLEPGKFYSAPAGKTWRYLTMPAEATVHLERLYTKARELWDLLGIPGVFRGSGGSQQPGYAIAQLMVAARSLFDPLVDNSTLMVGTACKYLLWQIWKRYENGVSVYAGVNNGRPDGWITLKPGDIAPDARGAGKGTPWLELTVQLDPLLPQDEAMMEERGQNAVQNKMMDRLSAMEKYYKDTAPERTMARMIAQQAMEHPVSIANKVYRTLVRSGELQPHVAVLMFAKEFGLTPEEALGQLSAAGVLDPEQQTTVRTMLEARQMAAAAAQQAGSAEAAGMRTPGGAPNVPPAAPPSQPANPTPAPPPNITAGALRSGPGVPLSPPGRGGVAQQQPSAAARNARLVGV